MPCAQGALPSTRNGLPAPRQSSATGISRTRLRRHLHVVSAQNTSSSSPRSSLVQALIQQIQKETAPWVSEIIQPLIQGRPQPLTDTVPPQELGDPDSQWIRVEGVNLHYKDYGPKAPGVPVVLLLHGFNGSVFSWRKILGPLSEADRFPQGCRVIAFDRPPFGLTERPLQWPGGDIMSPYTSEGGARLAAGLLEALDVPKAIVVGHSAGGLTAVELFRRAPERVAGLVLVAPALPTNDPKNSWSTGGGLGRKLRFAAVRAILQMDGPGLHYIRASYRKQAAQVAEGKSRMLRSRPPAEAQEEIDGYLRPMRAQDWDKGSLLSMRTMNFAGSFPYESITVPVNIIIGEEDTFLLKTAKRVDELLKENTAIESHLTIYPACGHVPMDDCRERFIQDLIDIVGTNLPPVKERMPKELPKPAMSGNPD